MLQYKCVSRPDDKVVKLSYRLWAVGAIKLAPSHLPPSVPHEASQGQSVCDPVRCPCGSSFLHITPDFLIFFIIRHFRRSPLVLASRAGLYQMLPVHLRDACQLHAHLPTESSNLFRDF